MSFLARIPVAVWIVLSLIVTATFIALSSFHDGTHSDAIVPVLVSLYKWEPFFWETDRNGQLIPLLARPFTHPLTNLVVQTGLAVFGGLSAAFLLAWFVFRDRNWPVVGGVAVALFLGVIPAYERYNMLTVCQPYLPPAAFALGGILLLTSHDRRWPGFYRAIGGALLTAAAYWCNAALALTLGPIVVGRFVAARWLNPEFARERIVRELIVGLGAIVLGTAFGQSLRLFASFNDTHYSLSPPEQWPHAWSFMSRAMFDRLELCWCVLAGGAIVGALWLRDPATRPTAVRCWIGAAILVLTLAIVIAATGVTTWAAYNGYDTRYLYLAIFGVIVAGAAVAVGPVAGWLTESGRRWAAAALLVVLPGIAMIDYGPPSVGAVRRSLDQTTGRWTNDILATGCTHVGGDYWSVWLAVFHTNLTLADRGEDRCVWGLTARSEPTQPLWRAVPRGETRIGWLVQTQDLCPSDDNADYWLGYYPDIRKIVERPTLWVYIPKDERIVAAK